MGDLTPDQRRIVQLPPQGHRVVFGPPGSGKTLVLIHRAAHLAQSLGIGEDRFVILCDIPGVEPKDIEIHMDKGILSIKGERKHEAKQETEKFVRVERSHGVFYRRFALPDSANPDGISATGKHGVLEVVIPKKPESTPRRIEVSA